MARQAVSEFIQPDQVWLSGDIHRSLVRKKTDLSGKIRHVKCPLSHALR